MSAALKLYTPELLALAVELANYPALEQAEAHGEARSPTCGSTVGLDAQRDGEGRIARLGMRVRACAVGQAAAAVFARQAVGRDLADIERALAQVEAWLAGTQDTPGWPGFAPLEPARAYPARHGALLLPWKAGVAALSSTAPAG